MGARAALAALDRGGARARAARGHRMRGLGTLRVEQSHAAPGVGLRNEWFPIRACDFVARHGVRGRAFNDYYLGGYMLWRFWPERDRLPFMDIHQTGTREDRRLAAAIPLGEGAWGVLDGKYAFDYAMLNRYWIQGDRSLDALDADTSLALVFMDDAAALYLRRSRFGALADSFAYRVLPGSVSGIQSLGAALAADSTRRRAAQAELERMVRESPFTGSAHSNLANIAMIEGRLSDARREILQALALDPGALYAHERLGVIALSEGRPRAALDALAREHPTRSTGDHRAPEEPGARAAARDRGAAEGAGGGARAGAGAPRPRGFAGGGEAEARAVAGQASTRPGRAPAVCRYSSPRTDSCAVTSSACAWIPHHSVSASVAISAIAPGAAHETSTGRPRLLRSCTSRP
jgi:hypothetical protein